jgi:hypothetical protein
MKLSKKDRMRMEGGKYSRTVGERIKRGTERGCWERIAGWRE